MGGLTGDTREESIAMLLTGFYRKESIRRDQWARMKGRERGGRVIRLTFSFLLGDFCLVSCF